MNESINQNLLKRPKLQNYLEATLRTRQTDYVKKQRKDEIGETNAFSVFTKSG